ncbi:MAG: LEPR-XLL domain-containing protein, partial [Nitrospira sp.]
MSLAKLFYMKETFRESVRRWRQACFRRRTQHSALRTQNFQLEALEPRLLLSATPTEIITPQELTTAAITVPAGSLPSLDVDLNGQADALSDGIVIIRHLFGFTGNALVDGAVDPDGRRTDPTEIANYLDSIRTTALDVDLNQNADAFSDGIMIIRSLFGFTDTALTDGAVDPGGGRTDPSDIASFLDNMNPQRELIAPLITVGLQQDTGISTTDAITFNSTITGTIADINQIASFTAGFDATPLANFTDVLADLQGNGTFTLSTVRLNEIAGGTLADGSHTLHLRATDARGNVATIDSTFTLDTINPVGSVTLAASSDTGTIGDRLTTLDVVTLTGQTDPFTSIVLTNNGATATADAAGLYVFTGIALAEGANQISLTMTDPAGNQGSVVETITRQSADGSILLKESGAWIVDVSMLIDLATATGTRTLRLTLDPQFDTTDTTAIAEDTFLISLVNPADLSDTLLDRGQNGTALFALHGTTAEFQAGLVTFDGTDVTIDLTNLGAQTTGLLRLQLLNHDTDTGSQVRVRTLTNTINPTGTPPTLFPLNTTLISRGGVVDLSGYSVTATAHVDVGNVRVDPTTGRYAAELLLHNIGSAIGRQAVVLFSNLPVGVTLRNPSGVNAQGHPYLNLTPAIPSGGLGPMTMSDSVLLEFDNPNFTQFALTAQVLVGPANQAPVITPITPLTVFPGGHLEVPFTAIDPDGDRVQFFVTSAVPLPTSMLTSNGTFIITPAPGETGTYNFTVVASDGALTSTQSITLTVAPDPTATTRISGRVVGTTGEPLAGVPIEVGRIITLTAADGTFTLDLPSILVPTASFNITIPTGDVFFDPFNTGTQFISMRRAGSDPATGTSTANPLQHPNLVTSFLDGNIVYGSDPERALALRTLQGGQLKTSAGNLLPFNTTAFFSNGLLDNDNGGNATPGSLFVAGDVRASENVALEAMHTILLREHNRLAEEIAAANPTFTDEQLYQQARRWLVGELQHIVYSEYLPVLLGADALSAYTGYNDTVDPATSAVFATAAFRLGHSQMVSQLLRLDAAGNPLASGPLNLRDAFFTTAPITADGIDPILRGLLAQQAQEIDSHVVDELRNFLFGPPGSGGMDLVSLNIQRGRDMGLPSYAQARLDFGLSPITSFSQITSDVAAQQMLQSVYGTVDKIDVWVGGIAEDHATGALIGPLFQKIIAEQFTRTRDADRFWYENSQFTVTELTEIRSTTFADIIVRNTGLANLPTNVFTTNVPPTGPAPAGSAAATTPTDFRSADGSGNHQTEPTLGQTGTNLIANFTQSYGDGISTPGGADRPGAREISNAVFPQTGSIPNTQGATALAVFFGQILSHDLSLTATGITDTMKIHGDQAAPAGTYPFVAEKLPLMLGHDVYAGLNNIIARPIFLPAIDLANADLVSLTQNTTVDTAAIPGAVVNIAAGTLQDREGNAFTGLLSITQVPTLLTPASLPPNLNPDLVVTIQPADMVLSTPAPISFPNTGGYTPGAILDLWSINPLSGQFDIVGKMQVSDDGRSIDTIEGGIRNSSWHFPAPPPENPPPPTTPDDQCNSCKATHSTGSEVELYSGGLLEAHDLVGYQSQGVQRGFTLAYDSLRADPRQIVQIGFENAQSAPDRYLVGRLVIENGNSSIVAPGGAMPGQDPDGWNFWKVPQFDIPPGFVTPFGSIEAAMQADLSQLPTGLYSYSATYGLQTYRPAETVGETELSERFVGSLSTFTNQVLSVNEIDSVFGAGWGLAGLQKAVNALPTAFRARDRINFEFDFGKAVLWQPIILVDGDGSQLVYRQGGTAADRSTAPLVRSATEVGPDVIAHRYASPVGDFSVFELLYRVSFSQPFLAAVGVPVPEPEPPGPTYFLDGFLRTMPDHTVSRYTLDGRLTSVTDRNGNLTRYDYDAANHLVKIVDPVGLETIFTYTGGKVSTITDPAGKITQLQYDAAGNLTQITDPDGSQRTWSYDAKHHMVEEIDQRGNREQELFDFAGRITQSIRKDGTILQVSPFETRALFNPELTTDWQTAPTAKVKSDADSIFIAANGNVITTKLDGAGQATVSFDSLGSLPTVERNADNLIIRSTDAAGNLTVLTYDAKGNLLTQRDALSGGNRVTAAIGQAGEKDLYSFTLKDDARLYFDSFTNISSFTWSLTGPTGTLVSSRVFSNSDDGNLSSSPVIFAQAGDYILIVDGVGNATGSYEFRMLDVKNAKPLALETQVANTLNPGNESDLYQFDGAVGDKLYFNWQGPDGFVNATWRLIDPFGNQVFGPTNLSTDVDVVTLTQTGAYLLLIEGAIGNTTPVGYAFTAHRATEDIAAFTLNAITNGTISSPGQVDRYTFTLSQASRLYFDNLTVDSGFNWSLSGPKGLEVNPRNFTSSDSADFGGAPVLDLIAGAYILTVDASGDTTGNYAFRLADLAGATVLTPGTPVSGTLSPGNETDLYRFTAQVGDRVFFDHQSLTGSFSG